MDEAAMMHDLRYSGAEKHCGDDKECLRKEKHAADYALIKDNIINAVNPLNLNPLDRATNMASAPAFAAKVAAENVKSWIFGDGVGEKGDEER